MEKQLFLAVIEHLVILGELKTELLLCDLDALKFPSFQVSSIGHKECM